MFFLSRSVIFSACGADNLHVLNRYLFVFDIDAVESEVHLPDHAGQLGSDVTVVYPRNVMVHPSQLRLIVEAGFNRIEAGHDAVDVRQVVPFQLFVSTR